MPCARDPVGGKFKMTTDKYANKPCYFVFCARKTLKFAKCHNRLYKFVIERLKYRFRSTDFRLESIIGASLRLVKPELILLCTWPYQSLISICTHFILFQPYQEGPRWLCEKTQWYLCQQLTEGKFQNLCLVTQFWYTAVASAIKDTP